MRARIIHEVEGVKTERLASSAQMEGERTRVESRERARAGSRRLSVGAPMSVGALLHRGQLPRVSSRDVRA
jgi:hypothetical protein